MQTLPTASILRVQRRLLSSGVGRAVPNYYFWVEVLRPTVRVSSRVQLWRVTVHPWHVVGVFAEVGRGEVAGFDHGRGVNRRRGVGPQDDAVLPGVR